METLKTWELWLSRSKLRCFSTAAALGLTLLSVQVQSSEPIPVRGDRLLAERVIAETNKVRAKHGLSPLKMNASLQSTSADMAFDLKVRHDLTHVDSKGNTFKKRMRSSDYMPYVIVGENLASGYDDVEEVVKAWMGSATHRKNIINPEFDEIGVTATPHIDGAFVWVQHFGHRTK